MLRERTFQTALLGALPAVAIGLAALWRDGGMNAPRVVATLLIVLAWLSGAAVVHRVVTRPLGTLANLLAALREGDYSIRARGAGGGEALGLVLYEANLLATGMRSERHGSLEATALLRAVITEIDVAIFTFDDARRLCLVNPTGARVLAQPEERLLGRRADELGLADCFSGDTPRAVEMAWPGAAGRWEARRSVFRQDGRPRTLLVLTDLSKTLREQERRTWQRLVRVLSHEINNSLAPIKSLAGSLQASLAREPRPADLEDDVRRGLDIIARRADALARFMGAYARLAQLPTPQIAAVDVEPWVRRVAALETRLPVDVLGGPPLTIPADGDQLDQLLINLVRNAVDAALPGRGRVTVGWTRRNDMLVLDVADEGTGVDTAGNLFVPFFTTKQEGSGIGLVLSRQIAEAHHGALTLANRADAHGAVATVILPVSTDEFPPSNGAAGAAATIAWGAVRRADDAWAGYERRTHAVRESPN
jgi:nitrogen fixation/metabolism regulation signal transduction histidine kinase